MRFKGIDLNHLKEDRGYDVPEMDRRAFLRMGLLITGTFAGGSILGVTSVVDKVYASPKALAEKYPYKPHYSMIIYQNRCIDCELCMEACVKTNHVPSYGYRTTILERVMPKAEEQKREFIPVLCNQCNNPPCVRGCPTKATYKNKKNGIVEMEYEKCIGCKTCMTACPYNARYFNETRKAVDKCDFCFESRIGKGMKTTACMDACPARVRVFGDLSDPKSEVYKMVHQLEKTVFVMKPETGAQPNVFYTRS